MVSGSTPPTLERLARKAELRDGAVVAGKRKVEDANRVQAQQVQARSGLGSRILPGSSGHGNIKIKLEAEVARRGYETMARRPDAEESLSRALTGQSFNDLDADQQALVRRLIADINAGFLRDVKVRAANDGNGVELPDGVLGAFVKGEEGGSIYIDATLGARDTRTATEEEMAEAIAEQARALGIDVKDGDAGARVRMTLSGAAKHLDLGNSLFRDHASDSGLIKVNGALVEAEFLSPGSSPPSPPMPPSPAMPASPPGASSPPSKSAAPSPPAPPSPPSSPSSPSSRSYTPSAAPGRPDLPSTPPGLPSQPSGPSAPSTAPCGSNIGLNPGGYNQTVHGDPQKGLTQVPAPPPVNGRPVYSICSSDVGVQTNSNYLAAACGAANFYGTFTRFGAFACGQAASAGSFNIFSTGASAVGACAAAAGIFKLDISFQGGCAGNACIGKSGMYLAGFCGGAACIAMAETCVVDNCGAAVCAAASHYMNNICPIAACGGAACFAKVCAVNVCFGRFCVFDFWLGADFGGCFLNFAPGPLI